MRIIFLDVDGVLNNQAALLEGVQILNTKVMLLENLLERSGAKIVLSSSWRFGWTAKEMEKMLNATGAMSARVIDITPKNLGITDETAGGVTRGHEIRHWLREHPEVTGYVILDDDDDMLPEQQDHFIQTDFHEGLTQPAVGRAVFYVCRTEAAGVSIST